MNVGVQIMRVFYTLAVAVSSNRSPLRGVVAIARKNSALAGGQTQLTAPDLPTQPNPTQAELEHPKYALGLWSSYSCRLRSVRK